MSDMGMLRYLQILQYGSCRDESCLEVFHSESLHRLDIEVCVELLSCCLLGKHPVVHLVGEEPCAEVFFEEVLSASLDDYFLRLEIGYEFIDIFECSFIDEVFSC